MLHYSTLLLLTFSIFSSQTLSTSLSTNFTSPIGINYGQVANNLPPPASVLPLLHSLSVTRVKLYDTDPRVLSAFANTGIKFIVGLPDQLVPRLARDPSAASSWVRSSILPHMPATKITAITVGNEVLTGNDTTLIRSLVPAMVSVQSALTALGLDGKIMVTTAHSLAVLETSFPPSGGAFRKELVPYLSQLLTFLQKTGSPFLINAYPYFAYKADPKSVSLNYVLFEPNSGVVDSSSGLRYDNMLHAQVDAVRTAIRKVTPSNAKVEIRVSETGWPSKGDNDEAGATPENAQRYNGNLLRIISQNKGTPAAPGEPLQVYVFALFNENLKPGPSSERHYGLFQPDGTPAYNLGTVSGSGLGTTGGKGNSGNVSSRGTAESPAAQIGLVSSTGYYSTSGSKILMPFCLEKLGVLAVVLLLGWYSF
ncbi:hypothetical protein LUZ62_059468 [Rhynchospora pubera]|uniref:glucan endo-1,3-beta-D-glucosidase n=1 Tax=Rhynchospora pubera TaxID=906938 RepID=A0AAV8EAP7_9POAL|nr:hypothetical protein LUZ62_059468 [Rhynchospora pubera]